MAGQSLSPKRMGARAWLELLLLSLIWGAVFMSVNVALKELGPLTIVAHRVGWACLILWIIVVSLRLNVPLTARAFVGFLGMGILNNALPFTLQAWSQLHIESGLTAILNATTAIWGVLIAAFFLADERLTWARTIGVCVGFLGVSMAVGLSNLAAFDMRSFGQISVIVSTISYAFAGVWARHFMQGIHPLVQAVGMLSVSTFIMVPLAISVEGPLEFKLSAQAWAALAYLAVIGTAGAYLLYYRV
ncbi:MAG: DMT family transporter, partial [Pseudomonadota bacterium]